MSRSSGSISRSAQTGSAQVKNVVVIVSDGVRASEIFSGADREPEEGL